MSNAEQRARSSQSESFKKLNPHLFPEQIRSIAHADHAARKMVRQQQQPLLNQTEAQFLDQLKLFGWQCIMCQQIKVRLGNGVWYTPDFVTFGNPNEESMVAWEVKGFMRDDAAVKLKVAAGMYPWLEWRLVHKDRGLWQYQIILS